MELEKTLVLLKPDAVQRGLMGRIIQRFEDVGLKLVAAKLVWVDEKFAAKHYFDVLERYGQRIFKSLSDYLTEGPVLAMVWEGVGAISMVRKLVGTTYPFDSPPGTIRGDFSHISKDYANNNDRKVGNLIHASAKPEEAEHEINLWFSEQELHSYSVAHESHTR